VTGSTVDPEEALLVPAPDVDADVVERGLVLVRERVPGLVGTLGTVADLDEEFGFVFHGPSIPFRGGTLHSGAEDFHLAVPHTGVEPLGLEVTLVAPILVVGVFPTFTGDEAVLVGPDLVVAVEQGDDLHGPSIPYSGVILHRSVVAQRFFQPVRATLQTTSACSELLLRQHDEGVEFHGGFPGAEIEDPTRRQLDPTIRGVGTGVEEGRLLRLGKFRRDLLELVGGHGRCHSFFFKDFVDQAS